MSRQTILHDMSKIFTPTTDLATYNKVLPVLVAAIDGLPSSDRSDLFGYLKSYAQSRDFPLDGIYPMVVQIVLNNEPVKNADNPALYSKYNFELGDLMEMGLSSKTARIFMRKGRLTRNMLRKLAYNANDSLPRSDRDACRQIHSMIIKYRKRSSKKDVSSEIPLPGDEVLDSFEYEQAFEENSPNSMFGFEDLIPTYNRKFGNPCYSETSFDLVYDTGYFETEKSKIYRLDETPLNLEIQRHETYMKEIEDEDSDDGIKDAVSMLKTVTTKLSPAKKASTPKAAKKQAQVSNVLDVDTKVYEESDLGGKDVLKSVCSLDDVKSKTIPLADEDGVKYSLDSKSENKPAFTRLMDRGIVEEIRKRGILRYHVRDSIPHVKQSREPWRLDDLYDYFAASGVRLNDEMKTVIRNHLVYIVKEHSEPF